jgi:UDP-glucuronate 4-epimerase
MNILVTGCAGFIGAETVLSFKKYATKIVGVDSLNKYYSQKLKYLRLKRLKKNLRKKFKFYQFDINNKKKLYQLFEKNKFDVVINLAAQAGVRYSLKNPETYVKNNINGFFNVIEACKVFNIPYLYTASSSSVYGDSKKFPLKEKDCDNKPIQFYAATKLSNEVMAHSYSSLYGIKIICLRFFTVYGPWGRPDMLLFKIVKKILKNQAIDVYNRGNHERDFTYIDDVSKAIFNCVKLRKKIFNNSNFRILNIGKGKPIKLMEFIKLVEKKIKKKAKKNYLPKQLGDVIKTFSSIKEAKKIINFYPKINHKTGISRFVNWYIKYENKI